MPGKSRQFRLLFDNVTITRISKNGKILRFCRFLYHICTTSGTRPKIESAIADTFTSFYKDLRRLTKYKRLLFLFSSVKNHLPLYLLDKGKISAGQSLKVGLYLLDVPVPPFQVQQAGDEFVIKTLPDYPARVAGGYGIRRNV